MLPVWFSVYQRQGWWTTETEFLEWLGQMEETCQALKEAEGTNVMDVREPSIPEGAGRLVSLGQSETGIVWYMRCTGGTAFDFAYREGQVVGWNYDTYSHSYSPNLGDGSYVVSFFTLSFCSYMENWDYEVNNIHNAGDRCPVFFPRDGAPVSERTYLERHQRDKNGLPLHDIAWDPVYSPNCDSENSGFVSGMEPYDYHPGFRTPGRFFCKDKKIYSSSAWRRVNACREHLVDYDAAVKRAWREHPDGASPGFEPLDEEFRLVRDNDGGMMWARFAQSDEGSIVDKSAGYHPPRIYEAVYSEQTYLDPIACTPMVTIYNWDQRDVWVIPDVAWAGASDPVPAWLGFAGRDDTVMVRYEGGVLTDVRTIEGRVFGGAAVGGTLYLLVGEGQRATRVMVLDQEGSHELDLPLPLKEADISVDGAGRIDVIGSYWGLYVMVQGDEDGLEASWAIPRVGSVELARDGYGEDHLFYKVGPVLTVWTLEEEPELEGWAIVGPGRLEDAMGTGDGWVVLTSRKVVRASEALSEVTLQEGPARRMRTWSIVGTSPVTLISSGKELYYSAGEDRWFHSSLVRVSNGMQGGKR